MAESTAGKVAGQATKQGMKMLTNTAINAVGASFGIPPGLAKPLLGCVIGLIALIMLVVFSVFFTMSYYRTKISQFTRDTSNGGALNSLTTVNPSVTIYVNLVYPGGSECTSAYGGEYIFKKDTTEVSCSSVTTAQRTDSGFKLGVKLAGTFYEGAAAANNLTVFPGGAPYSGSPTAAQGNTHWLYIPGYHNSPTGTPSTGVPVVGVITPTSATPRGDNDEDFTMRFDLLVKDGTEQAAIIAAWQANNNCKTTSNKYQCAVSGVIVKFGQPGTTSADTTDYGNGFLRTPRNFPRFVQAQGPWAGQIYGTNCSGRPTVGESGCGAAAFSNIARYYSEKGQIQLSAAYRQRFGDQVNPGTIATLSDENGYRACGLGTSGNMYDAIGRLHFGLRADDAGWDAVVGALRQQIPVITSVSGLPFSEESHIFVLYGIDEAANKVYISDSSGRNNTETSIDRVRNQTGNSANQANYYKIVKPL